MPENPTADPIAPERQALLQGLASQAAAWWRKRLEGHGYLSDFDNGDRSQAGETAQIMASMAALRTPRPEPSRLEHFEQLLQELVFTRLWREPVPAKPYSLVLRVDYGPEDVLREVAQEAGVTGFPWKTTMWVCWATDPANCYVEVRAGYGRDTQRLPAVGQESPATDC
jgi:hypothetical protein